MTSSSVLPLRRQSIDSGIDIVINNASAIDLSAVEPLSMKAYDLMQDINARGAYLLSKTALPHLRQSENPHILTLSPPINLAPQIVADAAISIVTRPPGVATGHCFVDEDVLARDGVHDFSRWGRAGRGRCCGHLGIDPAESVYTVERLRFGDDTALSIDSSRLPADLFPNLLGNDMSGSLYEILRRKYDVSLTRASSRVSAVLPTPREAELLRITTSQPCLRVIARGSTAAGRVAEITTSIYRGDLYELLIEPEDAGA